MFHFIHYIHFENRKYKISDNNYNHNWKTESKIPRIVVIVIALTTLGFLVILLIFNISRKIWIAARIRHIEAIRFEIKTSFDGFLSISESKFTNGPRMFEEELSRKHKDYRYYIDEYIIASLETAKPKQRKRLITISNYFDFYPECLVEIKNQNPVISARGSRRAGFYNFTNAADDMVSALDVLSSENQFEILMGLARMGLGKHLKLAFDKIKNSVIVNERAVIEILSAFPPGREKKKLFHSLFQHETSYLVALFLKAVDKEMTKFLIDDMTMLLNHENKEVRAAAVRGLASLDEQAPATELIQALKDNDWEVRALAAKVLGSIHSKESSLALVSVLDDRQWWVRQNVVNALICHPGYEKLFIKALKTNDKFSRDSIISALENRGNTVLLKKIERLAI